MSPLSGEGEGARARAGILACDEGVEGRPGAGCARAYEQFVVRRSGIKQVAYRQGLPRANRIDALGKSRCSSQAKDLDPNCGRGLRGVLKIQPRAAVFAWFDRAQVCGLAEPQ